MSLKPTSLRRSKRLALLFTCTRCYSASGSAAIPASKQKYVPTSGTYPRGFQAGAIHVGIKPSNKSYDDLALLVSSTTAPVAAAFTQNRFQAAPVVKSKEVLSGRETGIRAVVVNSGCANAVTGKGGLADAEAMVRTTDECVMKTDKEKGKEGKPNSMVMSTGVIGQRLPIDKITASIPVLASQLGSEHEHFLAAAKAICTTDTFPKILTREFTMPSYPGTTFRLAGMAKGAGMIHPNMATLLSLIWTDAPLTPHPLRKAMQHAVLRSFNSISIDGDTSTNDTLAVLANGAAVAPLAPRVDKASDDYKVFESELTAIATDLAQLIVRDGEGATKFVTIRVQGGQKHTYRLRIAKSIATSPLVKTALYGKDANWGRILCAIGYTPDIPDATIVPEKTSVSFVRGKSEELPLLVDGEPVTVDEERAAKFLENEDLEILVRLDGQNSSEEEVKFWTCDFSHEYVTINGDYRT